jgi:hypothetical protein
VGSTPGGGDITSGNTMTVATDKAFSGTKALKVRATSRKAKFRVDLAGKLQNPARIAYMRMMVFVESLPSGDASGHWDLFSANGPSARGPVTIGVGGGQHPRIPLSRWLYLSGGVDCSKQQTPGIPVGKWTCIEVKVNEQDANHYSIGFDGQEQKGLTFDTNPDQDVCVADAFGGVWHVPRLQTFYWGWEHWHTQLNPVVFWIDDIVVDQRPIGCPR